MLRGKLKVGERQGEPISMGWAIDEGSLGTEDAHWVEQDKIRYFALKTC